MEGPGLGWAEAAIKPAPLTKLLIQASSKIRLLQILSETEVRWPVPLDGAGVVCYSRVTRTSDITQFSFSKHHTVLSV